MRFHGSASIADAQWRSAARAVLQQLARYDDLLNLLGSFWIRAQTFSDCSSIFLAFFIVVKAGFGHFFGVILKKKKSLR